MASSSSSNNNDLVPSPTTLDPTTTYVHADPYTFRSVVQRLTGGPPQHHYPSPSPCANKPAAASDIMGPRVTRPAFKLHERRHRHSAKKLEIKLTVTTNGFSWAGTMRTAASPVSTLDVSARGSPMAAEEEQGEGEEEKSGIAAAKGFYFSPIITAPKGSPQPQLLTLFPLHSPSSSTSD